MQSEARYEWIDGATQRLESYPALVTSRFCDNVSLFTHNAGRLNEPIDPAGGDIVHTADEVDLVVAFELSKRIAFGSKHRHDV